MRKAIPLSNLFATAILAAVALAGWGCAREASGEDEDKVPLYTYQVVRTYPHDRGAFTEGLTFLGSDLLESTGLNGSSTLRKVDLQTGNVIQKVSLTSDYFGEGATVLGSRVFQLTWQNQKCFVYNAWSLEPEREFSYTGEGWGLTTDGRSLIMSDGSNQIRFIDPATFGTTRTIGVFLHGQALVRLNELEYVKGEILANIWQTQFVARIDPATGKVLGMIDFTGLLSPGDYDEHTDVLNGIAYDPAGDRLFVTGKNWPELFEVRLIRRR